MRSIPGLFNEWTSSGQVCQTLHISIIISIIIIIIINIILLLLVLFGDRRVYSVFLRAKLRNENMSMKRV